MKRPWFVPMLFIFLIATNSEAGGFISGNGGHLVICPSSSDGVFSDGRTLLDLYEGVRLNHLSYKKLRGLRGLTLERAFPKAVDLFFQGPDGQIFKARYLRWFQNHRKEIKFKPSLPLWAGSFSWALVNSPCHVEQALIQYLPREPETGAPSVLANEKFWEENSPDALPTDLKVALLMHEYVFRHLWLTSRHCALRFTREIAAALLADRLPPGTPGPWDAMNIYSIRCERTDPH